jgi:superfamily I DNA and/or RNA helicase
VAAELSFPAIENKVEIGRWLSDAANWTERVRAAKAHSIPLLLLELPGLFPSGLNVSQVVRQESWANEVLNLITANLTLLRLSEAVKTLSSVKEILRQHAGEIVDQLMAFLNEVGNPNKSPLQVSQEWKSLLDELQRQLQRGDSIQVVRSIPERVRSSGAPLWAEKLCTEPAEEGRDVWTPVYWQESWRYRQIESYLRSINKHSELKRLAERRQQAQNDLQRATNEEVRLRTTLELCKRLDDETRGDLAMVAALLSSMGTGTGKRAAFLRRDAQKAMERCYSAVPCWIVPSWRVSEMLPSEPCSFDLVIIDEASQSDIRELPVVLRGRKILVVGDDKQVSPSAIGIPINKIELLSNRFLSNQHFGPLMRPGFSLYNLFLAVFASQKIMLREHFRCVEPIIRFSFQFYEQKIQPLRIPRSSERLDPPLIDVYLKYGHKERNRTNPTEANYIVNEIAQLIDKAEISERTIGIIFSWLSSSRVN